MAVGRYSGSTVDAAEVDGFAVVDEAEEHALNTGTKAQDKTSEKTLLIKTSVLHGVERRSNLRTYNVQLQFGNNELRAFSEQNWTGNSCP